MNHFNEVSPKRLAEYRAIRRKVDAKARCLTNKELGFLPKGVVLFGSCHTFWKFKKQILRREYHMLWRSPDDLNPGWCID